MNVSSKEPAIVDRIVADSLRQARPIQATLELTYRCNERCTHCYLTTYEDDARRVLTVEQWKHILRELRKAGVLYLILMGGEAMLNPHFWDISEYAVSLGFATSMITNGLKIDKPVALRLADTGFTDITLSLYSMDPQIHDSMTSVSGSHQRTMAAIQFLREVGIRVGVNCLLTKNNIDGFFALADWCIERKIDFSPDVTVTPKFNHDLSPTLLRASAGQIREYYRKSAQRWPNGIPRPTEEKPTDYICSAGKSKCAVTAYGELLTCIEVRESLGLLIEKSFNELRTGPVATKWRNLRVGQVAGMPEGRAASFCDHCPGMALHETNNALEMSDFFANLARIREEANRQEEKSEIKEI